jgi:anti-sigma regulatory factor (Ser/Thr protein kinase)
VGNIRVAREALTRLAEEVDVPTHDVALAVTEAVSNSVLHAFRGRDGGTISVRGRFYAGVLRVVVVDDGIGMVPNLDSPGLGVGASLISQLADEAKFKSTPNGTEVTMEFKSRDGA